MLLRKERDELLRRIERRKLELFTEASPYNLAQRYQLNVQNTVIRQFYEHSKLGRPPFSDSQRRAWEDCLWKVLRKLFAKHDPQTVKEIPAKLPYDRHMSKALYGWRLENLELFVNYSMDVPAALEEFATEEAKIIYGKCKSV